jgi:hypothetical protein
MLLIMIMIFIFDFLKSSYLLKYQDLYTLLIEIYNIMEINISFN